MTLTKLKTKNQLTIPQQIVNALNLHIDELFSVNIVDNYIKLTPVQVEPRYTPDELQAIDRAVESQKGKGKTLKTGKEFTKYIKKISK